MGSCGINLRAYGEGLLTLWPQAHRDTSERPSRAIARSPPQASRPFFPKILTRARLPRARPRWKKKLPLAMSFESMFFPGRVTHDFVAMCPRPPDDDFGYNVSPGRWPTILVTICPLGAGPLFWYQVPPRAGAGRRFLEYFFSWAPE